MGTGVLGGMLLATVLAVAFVPLFYLWLAGRGAPGERAAAEETQPGLVPGGSLEPERSAP
jgi:hypothetical protein